MNATTKDIFSHAKGWAIGRAANMSVHKDDARAILAEFYEWIEPEEDVINILTLEPLD